MRRYLRREVCIMPRPLRRSQSSTAHRPPPDRPVNDLFVLLGISAWKPVVAALLLPPVPFILLMLVGTRLVLPRRGLGWLVALTGAVLLWLSACGGTARLLSQALLAPPGALSLQRVAELKADVQARQPIAIVVLGAGAKSLAPEYGVSNLSGDSLERLRYGLWLGRETGAPVAFSGGVGWADVSASPVPEAQIAARIAAQDFGRQIKWTEERSRDTRENAGYTVPLLKEQGIRRAILVTHERHMPRAMRAFVQAAQGSGIVFEAAPIDLLDAQIRQPSSWLPSTKGLRMVREVLHEAAGRAFGA